MTSLFLQSATEVTKEWLGEILGTDISRVSIRDNPAFNSSVAHVELTYVSDPGNLPERMVVKVNKEHDGQNEIQFYQLAESINLPMIPRRLGMGYDPHSGSSYLLMEDVSDSHRSPVTREQLIALQGIPERTHLESVVDVIAHFHAAFWDHPGFGTIPVTTEMRGWYRNEDFHTQHVERRAAEWQKFVERFGHDLPLEWIALGESALRALPGLFETRIRPRLSPMRALTLSQGDCYLTQFLVPRAESGPAYLIDFQDACVNFPAYDLVYMFATFWTREQRAGLEKYVLRRYLHGLQSHGLKYTWENLCNDYRLCLCYMLFDAVWNATSGSAKEYWFPKLQCLIQAYQDWDCAEL
jgi:hypothetical protein